MAGDVEKGVDEARKKLKALKDKLAKDQAQNKLLEGKLKKIKK